MKKNKPKVLLGMSGGVDSSVSALLLKKRGFDVYGVTMKLWEGKDNIDENICCTASLAGDARRICDYLEIPYYIVNYKDVFFDVVIKDFVCSYLSCNTPNPCLLCNKYLKFGKMYELAKQLGIEYVATGHYARIEYSNKYERYILRKSPNEKKDQSYFLYNTPKEILAHIIFPLEEFMNKEEVRKIAKDNGLQVASKPDSQDICFLPDGDYKKFINEVVSSSSYSLKDNIDIAMHPGEIVDTDGKILGSHKGLYRYTIGQRKGIGIASKVPFYVIRFDMKNNRLIVGAREKLIKRVTRVRNVNLLLVDKIDGKMNVNVKVRYQGKDHKALISQPSKDEILIEFLEDVSMITPGQAAVFYVGDIVLGGGKICGE